MIAHYPTSAEMAAFRRTFPHPVGSLAWRAIQTGDAIALGFPGAAAFADEREHGIGATDQAIASPRGIDRRVGVCHVIARREAARIRHAAFERITFEAAGDAGLSIDLGDAVRTFAGSFEDYHEGHGGAAGSFWPDCPLCPHDGSCDCHETADEHDRAGERQDAAVAY